MGKTGNVMIILTFFILFISWIAILLDGEAGWFFTFELVLFVLFLLAALVMTPGLLSGRANWRLLIIFFLLNWINHLIIYFATFQLKPLVLPFVITGVGFAIVLLKMEPEDGLHEEPVSKKFSPGKYVASKTGAKYHAPKCDWAKKIKKERQVWFDSKEEAEKQYSACSCVI